MKNNLIELNKENIRKIEFENEYYYVLNDLIKEIIESKNPEDYIQKLKQRNLNFKNWYGQFVRIRDIETKSGIKKMSCINFENLLKLIEFIPSKKVENFKNHLYEIGLLKIEELEK